MQTFTSNNGCEENMPHDTKEQQTKESSGG